MDRRHAQTSQQAIPSPSVHSGSPPSVARNTRFLSVRCASKVIMLGAVLLANGIPGKAQNAPAAADRLLARVNGEAITQRDLNMLYLMYRVPSKLQPRLRDRFLEELIDRQLIRQFLAEKKCQADEQQIDELVAGIRRLIAREKQDADALLKSYQLTEDQLRKAAALQIAWDKYGHQVTTDAIVRDYFQQHRRRLDGSRIRVSQIALIFPKNPGPAEKAKTMAQAASLAEQIRSGALSFSEAAKEHSQSPSAKNGGDLGWIGGKNRLAAPLREAAYQLEQGEISPPIETPFGFHLLMVTEIEPGDLSLEDVRDQILQELRQELWTRQVAELRRTAKIEFVP